MRCNKLDAVGHRSLLSAGVSKGDPRGDSVFRAALRDDGLRTPTPNKSIR
jgi:hypothetical protein